MSENKSDKWELPEPVFRHSEGEPVKPTERRSFDPEADTLEPGFTDRMSVDPEPDTLELGFAGEEPVDPEPDTLELGFNHENGVDPDADTLAPNSPAEPFKGKPDDPLANLYAPPAGHVENVVSAPAASTPIDVEPQPEISEQFTAKEIAAAVPQPKKQSRGIVKTFLLTMLFLILLGVLGVIVVFAYFYFAARSSSGGF